jgi:hypothetical protein
VDGVRVKGGTSTFANVVIDGCAVDGQEHSEDGHPYVLYIYFCCYLCICGDVGWSCLFFKEWFSHMYKLHSIELFWRKVVP